MLKQLVLSAFALLLPFSLFQQSNYSLLISTDDKPLENGFTYWTEVKISSKDTSFYYALHSRNPEKLEGLKAGSYTVTFTSVFNHSIVKIVELGRKKQTTVKVKGLKKYYTKAPELVNLSERLKDGDTLYIIYTSLNVGIAYEKIGITKKGSTYTALQFKGLTSDVFQDMQITGDQYTAVNKFELEAKKLKPNSNCNKAGLYTLALNQELYSFTDVSCTWHGLDNLKGVLFMQTGK